MSGVVSTVGRAIDRISGRRARFDAIQPGAKFRCIHPDTMVETAEVVDVMTNWFGIPHVRYHVDFRRPSRETADGGVRVLALNVFAQRYREPVTG